MSAMDVDRQGGGGGGISNSSMITVNNLTYVMEPDLTVAVNATYKKHFFANQIGEPSRSNICILNSGADYIDFRRSYLSFDFALKTGNNSDYLVYDGAALPTVNSAQKAVNGLDAVSVGFGDGSSLNLIQRIVVNSRSGDEICRVDNVAYISHMLTNYCYGQEWKDSIGSVIGMSDRPFLWEDVHVASQVRRRFHIPMYLLAGFFNYEKLMPSMLCSGLRIQIDFTPIKEALVMSRDSLAINPTLSYEITNLHIDAKSIQLTDSTQRLLNEMSASMGLDLVYTDINTTMSNLPSSGGDFHVEVRQACSRALRAWARIRDDNASSSFLRDSYAADHWLVTAYQWRLGSLYFPQQPVKAYNTDTLNKAIVYDVPAVNWIDPAEFSVTTKKDILEKLSGNPELSNVGEAHLHALEMFGKLGGKNADSTVSFDKFVKGTIPLYSHAGGLFYAINNTPAGTSTDYEAKIEVGMTDAEKGLYAKTQFYDRTAADFSSHINKAGWFNSIPNITRNSYLQATQNYRVTGTTDYGNYYGNHSIIPCNLERSTLFNLSGVPINNSRILGLDLNVKPRVFGYIYSRGEKFLTKMYPPTNMFSHKCDVFLQYIKLARVFMNNVEIEQ